MIGFFSMFLNQKSCWCRICYNNKTTEPSGWRNGNDIAISACLCGRFRVRSPGRLNGLSVANSSLPLRRSVEVPRGVAQALSREVIGPAICYAHRRNTASINNVDLTTSQHEICSEQTSSFTAIS